MAQMKHDMLEYGTVTSQRCYGTGNNDVLVKVSTKNDMHVLKSTILLEVELAITNFLEYKSYLLL